MTQILVAVNNNISWKLQNKASANNGLLKMSNIFAVAFAILG